MNDLSQFLQRWKAAWWLLAIGLAVPFALQWQKLPEPVTAVIPAPPAPAMSGELSPIELRYWKVLQPTQAGELVAKAPPTLRLAGTFLSFDAKGDDVKLADRYAIIDDTATKRQVLAHVGDTVAEYQVVQIEENFVVLEADGRRIELTRSLTPLGTAPSAVVASDDDPEKQGIPFWDQPALETNRFGKRIDTNRWVFKRDKVMEYYNELLADPARLVNLYKSFWPDRKNGEVDGFNIKYAGEQDFFKSVGLREGDTVRMVNSMKMTSQRRAEFFIGEFVRQNLDAIVFDIERDGKEEQLVYLIR
jgi:type II secretory pathway component PulC